jgi:hypothetical protein
MKAGNHDPPAWFYHGGDVRKLRFHVLDKEYPEAADSSIKWRAHEIELLHVPLDKINIQDPGRFCFIARLFEHAGREIHGRHPSVRESPGYGQRGMPGPAGDIKHLFFSANPEQNGHVLGAFWKKTKSFIVIGTGYGYGLPT